jgi:hypothetical protein
MTMKKRPGVEALFQATLDIEARPLKPKASANS